MGGLESNRCDLGLEDQKVSISQLLPIIDIIPMISQYSPIYYPLLTNYIVIKQLCMNQ